MIVYLKNGEIERDQWDNCIKNSTGAKPYAYSWYLDNISPGWEALVDDDYDSVFPVPCSVRFGVQYVSTPLFLQQLGAFSPDKNSSSVIVEFLDYMPGIFKMIDLCIGQNIDYPGYKVTEKSNFELNLAAPYEKLWEKFSPECRRNISNTAKRNYELTGNVSPEELTELCIENKVPDSKGVKLHDYERLKNLMNYCITNKKGRIIGVRGTKRRLVYGVFIVQTPNYITILIAANTMASFEKHIGYSIINEIIKEYASNDTILDFAGTSYQSSVSVGQSFGGPKVPYYRIHRNRLFWPVRIMK
jgi:hypothetical protein